jgi:hypothetical protein
VVIACHCICHDKQTENNKRQSLHVCLQKQDNSNIAMVSFSVNCKSRSIIYLHSGSIAEPSDQVESPSDQSALH